MTAAVSRQAHEGEVWGLPARRHAIEGGWCRVEASQSLTRGARVWSLTACRLAIEELRALRGSFDARVSGMDVSPSLVALASGVPRAASREVVA